MFDHIRVLLSVSLFILLPWHSVSAQTFKIATLVPENSYWMEQLRDAAARIKKQTDNQVKFKFYPGGVMGGDKTVLRKIRLGQLQGAAVTNGSLNNFYPDIQLYNLAMVFSSLDEVDFVREKMDAKLMRGLGQSNFVPMGFAEMGFAYLMSKDRIQSVADLRKQKVWIPEGNPVAETAMDAFKVNAVPLPIRDVLVGLQTGLLDTVAASPVGALMLQWYNHINYIVDLPVSYIFGVFIMDKKALKKLSFVERKIVEKEMGQAIKSIDRKNRKDNIASLQTIYKQGVKKITLTSSAQNEFDRLVVLANKKLITESKISLRSVNELRGYVSEYKKLNHSVVATINR